MVSRNPLVLVLLCRVIGIMRRRIIGCILSNTFRIVGGRIFFWPPARAIPRCLILAYQKFTKVVGTSLFVRSEPGPIQFGTEYNPVCKQYKVTCLILLF